MSFAKTTLILERREKPLSINPIQNTSLKIYHYGYGCRSILEGGIVLVTGENHGCHHQKRNAPQGGVKGCSGSIALRGQKSLTMT
jgi:hypothetical protein